MSTEAGQAELKSVYDLHLAKQTPEAARLARQHLAATPSVEWATEALVITTAQVDGSSRFVSAFPHLLEIVEILGGYYPIAKEESVRLSQEKIWRDGFEGRSGYFIALRDMYRSFKQLSTIIRDPGIVVLTLTIREKLEQFALANPNDREAIQFQIQEGKYSVASRAYGRYEMQYATQNPEESVILSATVFAKAIEVSTPKSWVEAIKILSDLAGRTKSQPQLKKLVGVELAKKLASQVLKTKEHKRESFHRQLKQNTVAYDLTAFQELGKLRV